MLADRAAARPAQERGLVLRLAAIGRVTVAIGGLGGAGRSHGLGINEKGLIAGVSGTWNFADFTTRRAVLYSAGPVRDLNELVDASGAGWHLHMADGVNNSGQIVGKGIFNGGWHAFLLSPVKKGKPDD